jgi:autotransporter-associated beta strand protein
LSRVNTYTGATTISAGTLELDATGTIAASSGVVNSGTFTIAANKTIDSMSGAGATTLGGTLTIGDASNTSSTYTGVMSGAGGLTKAGTGTLTLGGANTYAGTTTVSAGTLAITDASALGSTAAGTTVTAGATLNVNNVALAAEAITLNGTGVGSAGALTGTGAASLAGTVNLASPSTVGTTSAASSLTLNGAVSAPSVLTIAGAGDLTASNAGNDFSAVTVTNAGNVSLRDANDITLNASTMTGGLAIQASGTINVSGAISANGTGDAIVLSGGRFVNSAGAGALTTSAPGARWLVWSTNPNPFGGGTPDNRGGLAYSFKQYNAAFGDPVLGAGNGFLYALAPSITPGLTGTVTRVYDGSTTATLLAGNFTATGAVDGDTVTLSGTGAYDTRNAGTLKTVTATGITASAINGAATVYGYAVSPNTANGAIGEITAAPLMVTAQTDNRVYDGTTSSTAAPVVGALFAGDAVVTAPTQMYDNQNAGINKTLSASGLAINDGNGGNNYTITYVPNATGVITARGVTVTANNVAKIYGDADPAFTFNVGGLGLVGGDTVASVFGGALARAAGENVAGSPYAINQATLAAGDPNYNITTFTPGQFIIMPRPLTIAADNKSMRSGDLLPPFTATYAGFAFLDNSASLTGALAFTTPATIGSPVGAYVITPSGQASGNYTISYVNGTLSVSAYGGVPADVLASINSGGSQLPPPTVSSLPAIPSALLAVQPANPVAESAATALALTVIDALPPPSAGGEVQEQALPSRRGNDQRRVLTGAVNRKVDIINEGVNLPSGVVR